MASVWLTVIAIIIIVVVVMKISSEKQAWALRIVMILFIFIMLTIGYIYAKNSPRIDGISEVVDFGKTYFVWLGNAFGNVKETTGYLGKQDWSVEGNKTKN
ncbi:hypothetical protein HY449_02190 [Candidatus Pacearchaeota archaeon]|nr:hypothetical protein [Candidatus Pacearchaeota archaeon]